MLTDRLPTQNVIYEFEDIGQEMAIGHIGVRERHQQPTTAKMSKEAKRSQHAGAINEFAVHVEQEAPAEQDHDEGLPV